MPVVLGRVDALERESIKRQRHAQRAERHRDQRQLHAPNLLGKGHDESKSEGADSRELQC